MEKYWSRIEGGVSNISQGLFQTMLYERPERGPRSSQKIGGKYSTQRLQQVQIPELELYLVFSETKEHIVTEAQCEGVLVKI